MKRGFIPLIALAIVGVITALAAGGAFMFYKVNRLEKENRVIAEKLQEKEKVSTDASTSTSAALANKATDVTEPFSTSTSIGTAGSMPVEKTESPKAPVKIAAKAQPDENMNVLVEGYWETEASIAPKLIDYLNTLMPFINDRLNRINGAITDAKYHPSPIPGDKTIQLFEIDKKETTRYRDLTASSISEIQSYINKALAEKEKARAAYYSRSNAIKTVEELGRSNKTLDNWQLGVETLADQFVHWSSTSDKGYADLQNQLNDLMAQAKISQQYTLPTIPSVSQNQLPSVPNLPSYRETYCNTYESTINCKSYAVPY